MVVLCGPKYCWRRTGDIPSSLDAEEMEQPDKSVSHEGNSSTLRSRAEESNLGLLVPQDFCVMKYGIERGWADLRAIVLIRINNADSSSCIGFDFIPIISRIN